MFALLHDSHTCIVVCGGGGGRVMVVLITWMSHFLAFFLFGGGNKCYESEIYVDSRWICYGLELLYHCDYLGTEGRKYNVDHEGLAAVCLSVEGMAVHIIIMKTQHPHFLYDM